MNDIGGGAGNDGFDLAFIVLELVALLASVVLAGVAARQASSRPGLVPAQIAIGLVAGIVVPTLWNVGWPSSSGLEGAGRFVIGGVASGVVRPFSRRPNQSLVNRWPRCAR